MSSSYPVPGRPFNSGPVWDQMRFTSEETGTMPIAGSYLGQLRDFFTGIPSGLSSDDRMLYGLLGAQSIGAQETARQNKEMMREWIQYQKDAAMEANKMGRENQIIGSILKDVPMSIANAFAQRTKYGPERIDIARSAMIAQANNARQGIPNYYSFVR